MITNNRRSSKRNEKEKDFWRQKAKDEVLAIENEAGRMKTEKDNELGWERRLNESNWVLECTKGVAKLADKKFELMTEENSFEMKKSSKFKIEGDKLRQIEKDRKKQKEIEAQKAAEDGSIKPKGFSFFGLFSKSNEEEVKTEKRIRNAEAARKEEISMALVKKEEREKREVFLKENGCYIKILERSLAELHNHRMPPHHVPSQFSQLSSSEEAVIESAREANLRNHYDKPLVTRLDNGPSRSIQEVIQENRERQKHVPAGRYHNYRGSHILYPLRDYPATVKVILLKVYSYHIKSYLFGFF